MLLPILLALPFTAALILLLAPRVGRNFAAGVVALAAVAGMGVLVWIAPAMIDGEVLRFRVEWLPLLGLSFSLRIDGFAWMFAAIVLGIGALVVLYARWYLAADDPPRRFFGLLALFMGAMLGITIAGNLLLLVVFWEMTSVSSFLLIGFWNHRADARLGARMALTITGAGGLCLLAGVLLIGNIVGSYELDAVLAAGDVIRADPLYLPALILVLLGAFTKSAQFPFHFWLPHAMAAPTPVSAYLHSATMVKAGVFLLGRMYPALAGSDEWFWIVTSVGLATMVIGAALAIVQQDLKGLLAYSTISHLGLITLLFGLNTQLAVVAAVFHILNHATFKASLFMAAGIIDHETGTRDFRKLNGLWRYMPVTGALAVVASLSMAGVPLLNGFLSKEMFLTETLSISAHPPMDWVVPAIALLGAIFSVAYSVRFVHDVFFGGEPLCPAGIPHEPARFMRVPVEVLVVVCLAVGIAPQYTVAPLLEIGARGVLQGPLPDYKLSVWHGINLPLIFSMTALIVGTALYFLLQRGNALHRRDYRPLAKLGFDATLERVLALARRITAALENESLQRYLLLFVLCVLALGSAPFLAAPSAPAALPALAAHPLAILLWVMAIGGVIAVLRWHRERFLAVILVGAVGLAVSLTFVLLSAPDLALTQLLVEMISVILLLMALRWLPQVGAAEKAGAIRWLHAAVAVTCGVGTTALVYAVLSRPTQSISEFFLRNAVPEAGGANAVNVIIVDFRAFDTLGEIAVYGIAALIIHAMLKGASSATLPVQSTPGPHRPSLLLQISTQVLLPLAITVSLYLFLRGHNAPGGGFIAALLLAVALVLQYMAAGVRWSEKRIASNWHAWIGYGLLAAVATGIGSFAFGYPFLTSSTPYVAIPAIGAVPFASAMGFDTGVYMVVFGASMLMVSMLARLKSERGPD